MSTSDMLTLHQPGEANALIIIIVFAFLSFLAIALVLSRYTWIYVRPMLTGQKEESAESHGSQGQRFFFSTQLGAYTLSMLTGNLLQSLSSAFNVEWVIRQGVEDDLLCMTQAVLSQTGNIATAFFSAAVAVHSFNSLVLRNRLPGWVCATLVTFGWMAALGVGVIPALVTTSRGPVYAFDGLSCGVSWQFTTAQIILTILPITASVVVSVIFYTLVLLTLSGAFVFARGFRANLDGDVRKSTVSTIDLPLEYQRFTGMIVRSMTWLPVAYLLSMIVPIIWVLIQAMGYPVTFAFKVFGGTTQAALGLANALIVLNTVRIVSPHLSQPALSFKIVQKASDAESVYIPHKPVRDVKGSMDSPELPPSIPEKVTVDWDVSPPAPQPAPAYEAESRMKRLSRRISQIAGQIIITSPVREEVPELPRPNFEFSTAYRPESSRSSTLRPTTPNSARSNSTYLSARTGRVVGLPASPRANVSTRATSRSPSHTPKSSVSLPRSPEPAMHRQTSRMPFSGGYDSQMSTPRRSARSFSTATEEAEGSISPVQTRHISNTSSLYSQSSPAQGDDELDAEYGVVMLARKVSLTSMRSADSLDVPSLAMPTPSPGFLTPSPVPSASGSSILLPALRRAPSSLSAERRSPLARKVSWADSVQSDAAAPSPRWGSLVMEARRTDSPLSFNSAVRPQSRAESVAESIAESIDEPSRATLAARRVQRSPRASHVRAESNVVLREDLLPKGPNDSLRGSAYGYI